MALKNTHKYDDIIDLPRPVSQHRSRMSNYDRAAQFSPFAALTGFDATIEEAGRLTDRRIELEEGAIQQLDRSLREIRERLAQQPQIRATYFTYDERKAGGAYVTVRGRVKKIDSCGHYLLLTDGTAIPIRELLDLQLQ